MLRGIRAQALALSFGLLFGCDEPAKVKGPPPLPVVPAASAVAQDAPTGAPHRPKGRDDPPAKQRASASRERARTGSAKEPPDRARSAKEPTPAASTPKATTSPDAIPRSTATKSAPARQKTRVVVPHTEHVHADVSDALQADLDADPRMQAWLQKAMAAIDGCHAKSRNAVGTVQGTLTMHESARPSFALGSISPQLGGVVSCATGQLLRIKMPLFTGREGARHTVRINFE